MNHRRWIQIALGYLAVNSVPLAFWALIAPQSFFNSFPGAGRMWVASDGPFNEHLVRDVGALNLALVVVFVGAAVSMSKPLVMTACAAALAWGLPHFIYHVFNRDGLSTVDVAMSLSGLAAFVGLPLAIIWAWQRGMLDDGQARLRDS